MKELAVKFIDYCKTLPSTGRLIVIVLTIAIAGFIAYRYFTPVKKVMVDNPAQCDYLIEQNRVLVDALLEIRSDLKHTSYIIPAVYILDTIPRKITIKQIINKIDSILIKNKLDSIRRAKKQTI